MTALLPAFIGIGWAIVAMRARPDRSFEAIRAELSACFVVSAVITFVAWLGIDAGLLSTASEQLGWPIRWLAEGFLGAVPTVICVVGLVAVAMADSITHSISTLRRITLLLAVAIGFVATDHPLVLGLLWSLSPLIAWLEMRERFGSLGVARLLSVYHGTSVVLFAAAVGAGLANYPVWSAAAALAAIGIREAVIPGHSWFVRFVESAPMGLVVAFVGPQLGVYAHVELLTADIPSEIGATIGAFGAITAVLAALLGLSQTSLRRSIAYLMMSQTGLAAFGLQGPSEVAFAGSLVVWQVLALATSGLAMTVSALEGRRGALSLSEYSGCFSRTPRMAAGFLTMGLASVGFPMTLGFIAEDLLIQGAVESAPIFAFALIVATAINGINVMRCFFRLFSGQRTHSGEPDLAEREGWALSLVLCMLLAGGLLPGTITSREFGDPSKPTTDVESHMNLDGRTSAAGAIDETVRGGDDTRDAPATRPRPATI